LSSDDAPDDLTPPPYTEADYQLDRQDDRIHAHDVWRHADTTDGFFGGKGIPSEIARARAVEFLEKFNRPGQSSHTPLLQASSEIIRYSLTDASHAERFAEVYGDDIRYDHRRDRWLIYDQRAHRWTPDCDGQITRCVIQFARYRQHEALAIDDKKARRSVLDWFIKAESKAQIDRTLALSKCLHPIADAGDNWDSDPWLLCCTNGVLDLRSGLLRDGKPEDRITMSAAVAFEHDATCDQWDAFVQEIFDGDAELVEFVQRFVGYALTGVTYEQVLAFYFGKGANGKGTFMNTIAHLLGDYAYTMPFSTIEARSKSAIPNDVAALEKRRWVIASETNEGTRLNEARIKSLTGSDPVTARYLHGEFFTFTPVAKFVLAVNHKPRVEDTSYGFWRRIRMVPFLRSFQSDAGVAQKFDKLFRGSEAAGIFRWAVKGCLKWQADGLTMPAAIVNATAEYQDSSDPSRTSTRNAPKLTQDTRNRRPTSTRRIENGAR
jgi:putative DNA primase/helicase